jgi:TRAP-type C4-dicarboxylate transport system permease small subunit
MLAAYVLLVVSGFYWLKLTWQHIVPTDDHPFNIWLYILSALSFLIVIAGIGALALDNRAPFNSIYFIIPEALIIFFTIVCIRTNLKHVRQQDNET